MTATEPGTALTRHAGIEIPVLCGAMFPCSNPELVGAVSAHGGMGLVQPVSLTYVHKRDFRTGIREIVRLSGGKPIGMNALIEASSRSHHERMVRWVSVALEEGIRFFVTSLGNPRWVVERAASAGGIVYHDVTERRWALKGVDAGVHGLIAVNNRAGGHAGPKSAAELVEELAEFPLPLVCAGGVATGKDLRSALALGYSGVQMGTRFIASDECTAHARYKAAIVGADEADIVLTERLTGIPVAVINTPFVQRLGLRVGPVARALLRHRKTKRLMRSYFSLRALLRMRSSHTRHNQERDYWQAGKSVAGINRIQPVSEIMEELRIAYSEHVQSHSYDS